MKTIGEQVESRELPVFPTTYAEAVVEHGDKKRRRGRNPSMGFLEERNPRKALELAKSTLEAPEGAIQDRLRRIREFLPNAPETTYQFALYLADRLNSELVPQGFILGAELALYDLQMGVDGHTGKPIESSLTRLPPIMFGLISLSIPQIAKAIFPADFADHVKTSVNNINEIVKDKREAEKAALPPPTINGDPLVIYSAARRIADLAYDFYTSDHMSLDMHWLEDRRKEEVNPFFNQTTGGLFIETYYGIPGSIWTPWGKWGCWGSGSGRGDCDPMQDFLDSIGKVELFKERMDSPMGSIGPIYAVLQVDDVILPKPELREGRQLESKESKRLWSEVEELYSAQK